MITRAKNNFRKVYVLKDFCEKENYLECEVKKVEYHKNMMIHAGRIVIAYCECGCGALRYAEIKRDKEKFYYQLSNGIKIHPLEFC